MLISIYTHIFSAPGSYILAEKIKVMRRQREKTGYLPFLTDRKTVRTMNCYPKVPWDNSQKGLYIIL